MSQRLIRVNKEITRVLSEYLHTHYRSETVHLTLTCTEVSPDLRQAKVFYSVVGDNTQMHVLSKFLDKKKRSLRFVISQNLNMQYTPHIKFVYDKGLAHGNHIIDILNSLE